MPSTNQLRLPPIADEDLFEDFCRDLWALIWGDRHARRHGRRGQAQQGVDVYGRPAIGGAYEGVQAKAVQAPLTETAIQHEIDEAKQFDPPLRCLHIATTAPRDRMGQAYVRNVNLSHHTEGIFEVVLLGWEDIKHLVQRYMADHPHLLEHYFGVTTTSTVVVEAIREASERIIASNDQHSPARMEVLTEVTLQEHFHQEINYARSLINERKPKQALDYLSNCRERLWESGQPRVRYRVLHYLGCANYQLNRNEEAARDLIAALQYQPDDDTALAFAALGHLLIEENESATRRAEQSLTRNPSNARAYAILLQAVPPERPLDELTRLVPAAHQKQPEVASALAHLARSRGDLEAADHWVRVGVQVAPEEWPELQALLGEILLQKVLRDDSPLGLLQLDIDRTLTLQAVVEAFTKAWKGLNEDELRVARIGWLANRSLASMILGNKDAVWADAEAALRLKPGEPLFEERRAQLLVERGDVESAIRALQSLLPCPGYPPVYVTLAQALCEVGRYREAETVLDQCPRDGLSLAQCEELHYLKVRSAVAREDWEEAESRIEAMCEEHPGSPRIAIERAHLARHQGNRTESLTQLGDAKAQLTPDASPLVVYSLATEYYALHAHGEAAELYARIASPDVVGLLTERLIKAHYFAGNLEKALRLGQHLLALHGPLPVMSEIVAAIYEDVGDLPAARQTATTYLARHPNDFTMRLRLATTCQRARDATGVDAFLNWPIDFSALTLEQSLRLAQLYYYRERTKDALDLAYAARRRHRNESKVHLFYVSLFFLIEATGAEVWLRPDVVALDTAVGIRDAAGAEMWHVIEAREDPQLPGELPIDHPLAQKVIGKIVGDSIVLTEGPYSTEMGTISGLQSKYVHALQDSLRTFERLFPGAQGLSSVTLPLEAGAHGDRSIQPILDIVSEHHEYAEEVLRLYQNGRIPLGVLAKLLHTHVIEVWSLVSARPETGVWCSRGNLQEMKTAQSLLTPGATSVLDVIALLTLYPLGCREQLADQYGPFGIAQTTVDLLLGFRHDQKSIQSRGQLTIGKQGDTFVRHEISPADIQRTIAYLDGLVQWVDDHCLVLPVSPGLKQQRYDRLEEMMDPSFIDTLLLAAEDNRVLYTDDERLRGLARGEFGRAGVWTQVLLAQAHEDRLIDNDTYCRELVQLACMNYRHTHINAEVILAAARQSDWSPRFPFTRVIETLTGGKCDEASAVDVVSETMYRIARETLMPHQRAFLYDAMLGKLLTARRSQSVLPRLRRQLRRAFRLLPIQEHEANLVIDSWITAHPI